MSRQFLSYAFANRGPLRDRRPAAVPDRKPPSHTTGLTFKRVSGSSFLLRWTLARDNVAVAGYQLTVSTRADFSAPLAPYRGAWLGNTEAIMIEGVRPGLYFARLQAVDLAGNSGPVSKATSGTV